MKTYEGHLYETVESWYPVLAGKCYRWQDEVLVKGNWLSEYCPAGENDYNAWEYHQDPTKTIYFFREHKVAMLFTLRWV